MSIKLIKLLKNLVLKYENLYAMRSKKNLVLKYENLTALHRDDWTDEASVA